MQIVTPAWKNQPKQRALYACVYATRSRPSSHLTMSRQGCVFILSPEPWSHHWRQNLLLWKTPLCKSPLHTFLTFAEDVLVRFNNINKESLLSTFERFGCCYKVPRAKSATMLFYSLGKDTPSHDMPYSWYSERRNECCWGRGREEGRAGESGRERVLSVCNVLWCVYQRIRWSHNNGGAYGSLMKAFAFAVQYEWKAVGVGGELYKGDSQVVHS